MACEQRTPGHIGSKGEELPFADKLETLFDGIVHGGETEPPTWWRRLSDGSTSSLLHTKDPVDANPDYRMDRLNNAIESRSFVTTQFSLGKLNYSIGECIECLDGMEELKQGGELYLFALDIFLKKEYREVFLELKKANVREAIHVCQAWSQAKLDRAHVDLLGLHLGCPGDFGLGCSLFDK